MFNNLLQNLATIISTGFDVLESGYANDKAIQIIYQIEKEFDVRYILIDRENGQIESRTLHDSPEEAEKATTSLGIESYKIAMLFVPIL